MCLPLAHLILGVALAAPAPTGAGDESAPVAVQARRFALRVRLAAPDPPAVELRLWFTRDRGRTWERGPRSIAGQDNVVFEAPAEGLYGFYVVARSADGVSSPPPEPGTSPQRWVFVDYTPPLAQWKDIDVIRDAAGNRVVRLLWAAHDAHLDERPIAIAYQPAGQNAWQTLDDALPNTGRFDWMPPPDLAGRLTFKLVVRDLGGHAVERLFGPLSIDEPRPVPSSPATRPAEQAVLASPTASRPSDPAAQIDPARREEAQQLYERGTWHRIRGQFAEARERYLEALQLDPLLLPARTDLAGTFYALGLYDDSIREYLRVLQTDPLRPTALQGLALAYMARRDYPAARDALERLVSHNATSAEAWLNLGDVAFQMGDRAGARTCWTRATTADPSAADVILKARNRLSLFSAAVPAGEPRTAPSAPAPAGDRNR